MDPWYDYLAIPTAPLVLAVQVWALTLAERRRGLVVSAAGCVAVGAMFAFVAFGAGVADGDPNIGAGLLLVQFVVSLGLLAASLSAGPALTRTRRQVAPSASDDG